MALASSCFGILQVLKNSLGAVQCHLSFSPVFWCRSCCFLATDANAERGTGGQKKKTSLPSAGPSFSPCPRPYALSLAALSWQSFGHLSTCRPAARGGRHPGWIESRQERCLRHPTTCIVDGRAKLSCRQANMALVRG